MPEPSGDLAAAYDRAAEAIASADALVITAGAGMGVDSGLPDFRGTEGFWRAYPPFERLGLRFEQAANPIHFARDPELAWGFYGHRLGLYQRTHPHPGFEILRGWGERTPGGAFVFTSNVDGHFQRAGFGDDAIVECHGSLLHLQCSVPCQDDIWEVRDLDLAIDEETFRAGGALPTCPECGAVARPNVLMFGDWLWVAQRTAVQEERLRGWVERVAGTLVIVEIGAGTSVPTVRLTSEHIARRTGGALVRINPREPETPAGGISLPVPALAALTALDSLVAVASGSDRAG